jgi:hypothetical protein
MIAAMAFGELRECDRYLSILAARNMKEEFSVHDRELFVLPVEISELELQACWFAGEFGRSFMTTTGVPVEIIDFGTWNHESGPDFADAVVQFGSEEPVRGAIEVDTDVRDWEAHGHAVNPAYNGVVLHLFLRQPATSFFTRTESNRNVPQVMLHSHALETSRAHWIPPAHPGRCSLPFRSMPEEEACSILESASRYRLQRKGDQLARLATLRGVDEALLHGVATALGYKSNKLPFQLLAQRLPLRKVRRLSEDNVAALYFGVAGFLQEPDLAKLPPDSRQYLRALWEIWWEQRAAHDRLILSRKQWTLSGMRPANHPQRRIGALCAIVRAWASLRKAAESGNANQFARFFHELKDPYWSYHYTLASKRSAKPLALVGDSRVQDLLANLFFPLAVRSSAELWDTYAQMPSSLESRRVKTAKLRLFGSGPKPFLNTLAREQGLLQIYEDFCMTDRTGCAACAFPQRLTLV